MKRSKQIQLVLISAALASCNRVLTPQQSPVDFSNDSTLAAEPYYGDSTEAAYSTGCNCDDFHYDQWRSAFYPFTTYYIKEPGYSGFYYSSRRYRKSTGSIGGSSKFIVRSGFGQTGTAGS